MHKATSYSEITSEMDEAIEAAAVEVGAKAGDVRGFFLAGDDWDAETAGELTEEIVAAWKDAMAEAARA